MEWNRFRGAVALSVIATLFVSCDFSYLEKDIDDISIDGGIASAVGELTYSPADLFDDVTSDDISAITNEEGIVTVVYENQLVGESYVDFYEFEDQLFTGGLDHGVSFPFASPIAVQVPINDKLNLPFDNGDKIDAELTSGVFKGGNLILTANSTFSETVELTLSMPSFTNRQTGEIISVDVTLDGANPTFNLTESLSQFDVDFTLDKDGNTTTNNLVLEISGVVYVEQGSQITAADELTYSVQLVDIDAEKVYGDFKQHPYSISSDLVEIDFFNDFQNSGESFFANPSISIDFENSFGVPMGVDINSVYADAHNGQRIDLTGDIVTNTQVITAPTLAEEGSISQSNITINNANSNLHDLISSRPTQFYFDIDATTNPAEAPAQENFILDTSTLIANVRVELPLEIRFRDIVLENSIDFNPIEEDYDADNLNIIINTENNLALAGNLTLVFVDENGRLLHTEIIDGAFYAAPVDSDGYSNAAAKKRTVVSFDKLTFDEVQFADKIRTFVTFNSYDSENGTVVKLRADDQLKIKLSIDADASYNSGN